ncbi:hypothetical protein ACFSJ3_14400 [Corallincola platygyrae]|uniref:Uncharacterized protein n=1 Tax=Corallincola platygyrae TaxID=1193278 RepID=A0ABW4XSD2_9GAMM
MKVIKLYSLLTAVLFQLTLLTTFYTPNAHALTSDEKLILTQIRNNIFGGSRLAAAFSQSTISGLEPPVFPYEVENRGLLVWKVDPQQAAGFAFNIGLTPPFALAKSRPLTVLGSQTLNAKLERYLRDKGLDWLVNAWYPEHYYVIADIGETSRAEQGTKIELKTFVSVPGLQQPQLYRFASYKAIPGTDLLTLFSAVPTPVSSTVDDGMWQGYLLAQEGSLNWSVPIKQRRSGEPKQIKKLRFSEAFLDAGERLFGPQGSAARVYYDGSSVSGGFYALKSRRLNVEHDFAWSQFLLPGTKALLTATKSEFMMQPTTAPVQVTQGGPGICAAAFASANASQLFSNLIGCVLQGEPPESVFNTLFGVAQTQPQVLPPPQLPTLYFAVQDLYQGLQIYAGLEKPKLFFSLFEDPMAIFINFEIPHHKVKAFEAAFLPDHFKLAKIRFYPEQKRSVYAVSLNVYQSAGQNLNGFRAEWSTYVINPDEEEPKPRFSVLEAQTNAGGFDPLIALERYIPGMDLTDPNQLGLLIEPPSDAFDYVVDETDGILIEVLDIDEQITVDVSIAYPSEDRILRTAPMTEWMEANDFVYWGEVADILKYDSNVMFAELLVFDALPSDVIEDSTFAGYVDPNPLPIIFWNGVQDIALEPWGNLDGVQTSD